MALRLYPVARLLPHRGRLVLLDELVAREEDSLTAASVIRADSLFLDGGAVPAHVGVEYMAQACAAFSGAEAADSGLPARIGFLLGCRRYAMSVPQFPLGARLLVTVALVYRDEGMATFDGRILCDGALAAEGQLTVYQPPSGAISDEAQP
jgi:predicted hotdog family 3-hydroxylacyl-ACP dehydratase